MSMRFDATLKDIVRLHTADYEEALRVSGPQPTSVLNVDLSTVTAATDIALGHGEPPQSITDVNFQSGRDPDLDRRLLLYNVLLHYQYDVPVHSLVILLRPEANDPHLTGKLRYQARKRRGTLTFSFEVLRLWQRPVRRFLTGGLGILPLAPLCRLPAGVSEEEALARVIRQIDERLEAEADPADAKLLMSAAYILTGLRAEPEVVERLFGRVFSMIESSTYRKILAEGSVEEARKFLTRLAQKYLGPPSEAQRAALAAITDVDRLERMGERTAELSSWQELLAIV